MALPDAFIADASNVTNLRDRSTLAIPAPPGGGVIYGANVGDGNPRATLTERKADFGRVPMNRGPYYSNLPSTFPTSTMLAERTDEKRSVVSFQPDPVQVVNGVHDALIASFCESVPADWWVGLCYWSEPNAEILAGQVTIDQYRNACYHISALLDTLTSAARVVPCNIISAPKSYQTGNWVDSWMYNFDLMNNDRAIFCWDNYGNPFGGGTSGTSLYGPKGAYPSPDKVQDRAYNLLNSHGWCFEDGHWGITEFNAPMRVRGPNPPESPYGPTGDEDETRRSQWVIDYCAYSAARPAKPKMVLLWEGNGTGFDQKFNHTNVRDAYKSVVAGSA